MNKTAIYPLLLALLILQACKTDYTNKAYLEKVLNNLEQIKSATYSLKGQGWHPGDTAPAITQNRYVKEYTNLADTNIGASYVSLLQNDTTQMSFCYDGIRKANAIKNSKRIVIDSFNLRKLPFRPVKPPFFNYTKNIIKYALETTDSISLNLEDLGDAVHLKLKIFGEKPLEFFGKAYYYGYPFVFDEDISCYDIWISKSNDLPYKVLREQPFDIYSRTCSNVELNKLDINDFVLTDYFQSDYDVVPYSIGKRTKKSNFLNKKAPDWILKDADNNTISLKDLKSKVVMMQFTSVSCGPCRASIPFLKQLQTEYDLEDFDFVAIEKTSKNSNVLKSYRHRNRFDYKFLMSNKEINKRYQVQGVPVFFILDENRVVRKVIMGYGKGSTDSEIRDAINSLCRSLKKGKNSCRVQIL